MALTTTVGGVWVLQALLGVESMPAALRCKPYIPSLHESLIVETTAGPLAIAKTAEYLSLASAGVIDESGDVDGAVRDWMRVLGRPERQVLLTLRRPGDGATIDETSTPTVCERVMVVCRHRRWLAMAARDGEQMVIDAVGESDDPATQADLTCHALLASFGEAPPADVDGVNIAADLLQSTLEHAVPLGLDAVRTALSRMGFQPRQAEVLAAATRLDESAMAVVTIIDHGIRQHVHPRVLTVADTEHGRIRIATTTAADGRKWLSIFPAGGAELREDLTELLSLPRAA